MQFHYLLLCSLAASYRYAWEAMVINELSGLYLFFTAPNVSITVAIKGEVFLKIIGVEASMILVDIAVLVAMYVGACLFVLMVMWMRYDRKGQKVATALKRPFLAVGRALSC